MHRRTWKEPRYWLAKLGKWAFERRHPDAPWLCEGAVYILDAWLRPDDIGIEWGAGRSTIWLATRVKHLLSIESNSEWCATVRSQLAALGLTSTVELHHVPIGPNEITATAAVSHAYAAAADMLDDNSVDFALVDGIALRALCMEKAVNKLKPGGMLILDNAERYMPNKVLGEYTVAITPRDGYSECRWRSVADTLRSWRGILATNGVADTRMWIKPLA